MLRRSVVNHVPLGVVGIISPWNYPFSIPAGAAAMALVAGNCVLLKPSSATPIVGMRIQEMFDAAGLPEHVFTHVPGDAETGEALLSSRLDKVFFTGSVEVGRHVAEVCAQRLVPSILELGGKDPAIIRHDADIEHAASGCVWGAFTNAGQCCASIERVYVHKSIAEKFTALVAEKTRRLKIGNGLDPKTDVGPMTTLKQLQVVEAQVEEARRKGAKILTGGKVIEPGYFYEPTVITDVDHTFACVNEETFGPLMPIMTFDDDRQAIQLANYSDYGLNAYIWSRNTRAARKMALELQAGTVVINDCVYTHAIPQTPWGGVKHSGLGRTHSAWGFYELTNLHHTHVNPITFIKDFWWYPYGEKLTALLKSLSRSLTGCWCSKIKAIPALLRALLQRKM
jgi:succinate-semialdehyde dehydrogenase/glutarate-semialdehyde dehydrogenase